MRKTQRERLVLWGKKWPVYFLLSLIIVLGGCSSLIDGLTSGEGGDHQNSPPESLPSGQALHRSSHLVVLLVPGLDFQDAQQWMEALPERTQDRLQLAGMSMRTAGSLNLLNNMFTLASGQFQSAPPRWNAYQLTGERIIHPVGQLRAAEKKEGKLGALAGTDQWGHLADQLAQKQIYTLALGNSDTFKTVSRTASLLVMNQAGEAQGDVEQAIVTPAPYLPGGFRTDWKALWERLEQVWATKQGSLVVVELGDLWRLEQTYNSPASAMLKQIYKAMWLDEWQEWFTQLTHRLELRSTPVTIWVISPIVSQEAKQKGELLAPFITWSGHQKGGLITSLTTRQEGIVTNLDFLPSLYRFFQLQPVEHFYGHVMLPVKKEELKQPPSLRFTHFFEHVEYLFTIYGTRRLIISVYLMVMIFLLISTAAYWWFSKRRWGARVVQILIGTILISPIYFLWLTPLIKKLEPVPWIAVLFAASFLSSFILYRLVNHIWFLTLIGLANTVTILVDIWQGSPWMKRSFLGFDPLIGARYYGLGNEYAGILLGSSLLAVTGLFVYLHKKRILLTPKKRWLLFGLVSLFYLVIIYSMAAPQLGTNAGATMAAVVAYTLSLLLLFRFRLSWSRLIPLFGIAMLYVLFLVSLHLTGEQTHIGMFLKATTNGDIQWIAEILYRKWTMNWRLIKVSLWGKLFTTALVVMGLVYLRLNYHPGQRGLRPDQHEVWMAGFKTLIIGALSILVLNDSGVVAAATTVIYMTFPFIFLRFDRHLFPKGVSRGGLT